MKRRAFIVGVAIAAVAPRACIASAYDINLRADMLHAEVAFHWLREQQFRLTVGPHGFIHLHPFDIWKFGYFKLYVEMFDSSVETAAIGLNNDRQLKHFYDRADCARLQFMDCLNRYRSLGE